MSGRFPPGKLSEDRLATSQALDIVGHVIVTARAVAVGNTDLDRLDGIKAVDVGDGQFVDTVDHRCMTGGDGIEPAAPARTSGGRAKLTTHGVQHVCNLGV